MNLCLSYAEAYDSLDPNGNIYDNQVGYHVMDSGWLCHEY